MLVLSRKADESIQIGPDVKITIVRVTGDKVRIGIEAPKDVVVLRGELQPQVQADTNVSGDVSADASAGSEAQLPAG